ncbi:hypothetical protein [Halocatena halophila]|uniref:hypothetical protein n=1 Tax=Halocatena halophila TaxID=2814576 RepID=UPI002ED3060C
MAPLIDAAAGRAVFECSVESERKLPALVGRVLSVLAVGWLQAEIARRVADHVDVCVSFGRGRVERASGVDGARHQPNGDQTDGYASQLIHKFMVMVVSSLNSHIEKPRPRPHRSHM